MHRAILTSEIFAKALRRKEGGGAGVAKEEDGDPAEGEPPSEDEEESAASGKILNLISTDAPNGAPIFSPAMRQFGRTTEPLSSTATYVSSYLHHIWPETTLTIVVTVFLLFRVIGLAALAGVRIPSPSSQSPADLTSPPFSSSHFYSSCLSRLSRQGSSTSLRSAFRSPRTHASRWLQKSFQQFAQ